MDPILLTQTLVPTEVRVSEKLHWARRDEEYLLLARSALRALSRPELQPVWLTHHRVFTEMGVPYDGKRPKKLPKTEAFIAQHTETRESFYQRSVEWAMEQFVNEGVVPTKSQFIARIGISAGTFRKGPELFQRALDTISEILTGWQQAAASQDVQDHHTSCPAQTPSK